MNENPTTGGPAAGERYQHRKGGTYEVLGVGAMQAGDWCDAVWEVSVDMAPVVIYRSETDGLIWVRPVEEFLDGRFTALATRSSSKEA